MLTRGNLLPTALTRVTPDANFTAREPITQRFPFAAASLSDSVFPTVENFGREKLGFHLPKSHRCPLPAPRFRNRPGKSTFAQDNSPRFFAILVGTLVQNFLLCSYFSSPRIQSVGKYKVDSRPIETTVRL